MIPKFRLYDIVHEEMEYFEDYRDLSYMFSGLDSDNGFYEELMQSTGLLDINGKEIYIGDLVKCDLNINDTIDERVYEVVDNGFELILEHVFTAWHLSECINSVEVIGNIHQNPNLLEADSHER